MRLFVNRKPILCKVRAAVMKRSCGVCEDCGGDEPLEFHHLTYNYEAYPGQMLKEGDGEWIFGNEKPEDLAFICRACHKARHIVGGEFYSDPEEADHRRVQYERDMAR